MMHHNAWDAFSMTNRLIESYFNVWDVYQIVDTRGHFEYPLSSTTPRYSSRYARLVDVNQFFFFFKLRNSNKFGSKIGAIRSAVSECKNERYAKHYYPLLCEVLRYVTTKVWLPCFTLYEFTRELRFAIERGARFAPPYLARALQVVRALCS